MKIFHTICAAFMAATIASCDAHQDFTDTSMKIGDIVYRWENRKIRGYEGPGENTHSRGFLCQPE